MKAMNMPGFTAAASVYRPSGHYRLATSGIVAPVGYSVLPQLKRDDLPGASCSKNILGNVICVECTSGPSPTCKTYVCDKDGNNCTQTSRINTRLTAFRATSNLSRLAT